MYSFFSCFGRAKFGYVEEAGASWFAAACSLFFQRVAFLLSSLCCSRNSWDASTVDGSWGSLDFLEGLELSFCSSCVSNELAVRALCRTCLGGRDGGLIKSLRRWTKFRHSADDVSDRSSFNTKSCKKLRMSGRSLFNTKYNNHEMRVSGAIQILADWYH